MANMPGLYLNALTEVFGSMGLIGPNELVAQIHPRMPVILPLATSRCVVRRNGRWRPKSVVAPLPCRPDANVGNFPTGKQPKEMMIHRSGNPFIQSQHRQQPMRLNSCASRLLDRGPPGRKWGKLSRRPLVRTDTANMLKRRLKQAGLPAHYLPHSVAYFGLS